MADETQPQAAPVAPAAPAPAPKGMPMLDAKGAPVYVPQENVQKAISDGGYKLSVDMTDPQGNKWHVPFDQQDKAQKEGKYTWDVSPENDAVKSYMTQQEQPTQFSYPAAGPGGMIVTTTMPKQKADQLEQEGRDARTEAGKQAIIATATMGAGALVGPALEFLGIGAEAVAPEAQKIGTGLYDEFGKEIFKDVAPEAKRFAGKILSNPTVQKAIKHTVRAAIGGAIGEATGGHAGGLVGGTVGAALSDKVLKWVLSE